MVLVNQIKSDLLPPYSPTQYEILIHWPGLWNYLSPHPQSQTENEHISLRRDP